MDKAWRLHLTNRTIQHLDILEGDPPVLAVWYRRDRVAFYHLHTGVALEELTVTFPETQDFTSLEWQNFIASLQAPNKWVLPYVRGSAITIYSAKDKSLRLYEMGGGKLEIQKGVDTQKLDLPEDFQYRLIGFDGASGAFAVMDENGNLHIYRSGTQATSANISLKYRDELSTNLGVAKNGSLIYVTDGRKIIKKDVVGAATRELPVHYLIRQMQNTPDAKYLVTSDLDTGVLRVYDGDTLEQTHQSFAIDLVASSVQLQLIADLPPVSAAVSALSISSSGIVAFAMYGVVCVTHIDHMNVVPV